MTVLESKTLTIAAAMAALFPPGRKKARNKTTEAKAQEREEEKRAAQTLKFLKFTKTLSPFPIHRLLRQATPNVTPARKLIPAFVSPRPKKTVVVTSKSALLRFSA